MGLKGKLIRRQGTELVFGSRNKPEWRPMECSGRIDIDSLQPGEYYDIEVDDNRVIGLQKLPQRQGAPEGARVTYQAPGQASEGAIPLNSLMASATGFAKSCLESGRTPEDAAKAGIVWARAWAKGLPEIPSEPEKPKDEDIPW